MSGIALEHVSKVFPDGTAAVVDMDLRIHDGEFFVLVGPSGCGKSTVLRLVAGLEKITRGTIRIGDHVVNDVPPGDRDIAMAFETAALYPHLDVADNMGLALRIERRPGGAARRARQADRLPVGHRRSPETPAARSRRGRTPARRARARDRAPATGVPHGRAAVRAGRRAPLGDAGFHRTPASRARQHVFYVTHDQAEAMALADRVAVMRAGRLEQIDEPRVLYDRPATLFAATFIGSPPMNLWHVRLAEENGRVVVVCGDQRLSVPRAVLAQRKGVHSRVGGHLVLGLRPEMLKPSGPARRGLRARAARGPRRGARLAPARHFEAEGAGLQLADAADVRMRVHEDDEAPPTAVFSRPVATLAARLPPHAVVAPGDRLRLFVDLERAHFFDPDTQCALR